MYHICLLLNSLNLFYINGLIVVHLVRLHHGVHINMHLVPKGINLQIINNSVESISASLFLHVYKYTDCHSHTKFPKVYRSTTAVSYVMEQRIHLLIVSFLPILQDVHMTMMLLWSADKVSQNNNISCVLECLMLCRCTFTQSCMTGQELEWS